MGEFSAFNPEQQEVLDSARYQVGQEISLGEHEGETVRGVITSVEVVIDEESEDHKGSIPYYHIKGHSEKMGDFSTSRTEKQLDQVAASVESSQS